MSISGHKTENVYIRYDIVDERDLSDAAVRMNDFLTAAKEQARKDAATGAQKSLGTLLGTLDEPNEPTATEAEKGLDLKL